MAGQEIGGRETSWWSGQGSRSEELRLLPGKQEAWGQVAEEAAAIFIGRAGQTADWINR